jgi:hypothetical protein
VPPVASYIFWGSCNAILDAGSENLRRATQKNGLLELAVTVANKR